MSVELYNDQIKVKHLLKADSFGQIITVYNKENNCKAIKLVEDTDDFFCHIYENATGGLCIDEVYYNLTIDKWLKDNNYFSDSLNCLLFFIEGYAGCGKSTLVQYILYKILDNPNYEYSYYNYDIGSYPDNELGAQDCSVDFIKYSILHKLKNQIINIIRSEKNECIFENFLKIMNDENSLRKLDVTLKIRMNFGSTEAFKLAVKEMFKEKKLNDEKKISNLKIVLEEQLKTLNTYQLLCIDYLWRLAQYLSDTKFYRKYMYVCYDNLDSIMNYDLLCNFKDQLITFRNNLSSYILELNTIIEMYSKLYDNEINKVQPFIIFSTYRKITAIRSINKNTEMLDDIISNKAFVKVIEVSKQYNFTKIAERRIRHFSSKLHTTNICGSKAGKLIQQMKTVDELKRMMFVKTIYAGLWNNNLRSCSNVLSDLIEFYDEEVDKCKALCKENFDGHIQDKYCYYGASSIFLHVICKLLNKIGIFGEKHLDLINIKEDTQKKKTSLSRLIITYLYTENRSVPITELFEVFDKVFDPKYICKIIGQLMTRVQGEVWRRPIYYSKYALDNEIDIKNKLFNQYEKYQNKEEYKYVEFKICDCGERYINAIVPHFEFYSIRINEEHQNLYCIENLKELTETLKKVYEKIKVCCKKQIEFLNEYIEKYKLERSQYLTLSFHPRTRSKNPQLHIERVIFSHIAYFNNYRIYLVSKKQPQKYDGFNKVLLVYIKNYLGLYDKYVSKISSDRNEIAEKMKNKIKIAETTDKYISIET